MSNERLVEPQSLGLNPAKVDKLLQRVRREVDEGLLPAAQVALARHGKIGVFESQTRVHKNWTLRQHSYGLTLGAPYAVGDNDSGVQQTGSFRFGDTTTPSMMQGVQILRIHEVDEVLQGTKVFRELIKK